MILTEKEIEDLEEAAKPLIKFLCDNFHPHVTVVVKPSSVELFEGAALVRVDDYVKE